MMCLIGIITFFSIILQSRYYGGHFMDEETEAWRCKDATYMNAFPVTRALLVYSCLPVSSVISYRTEMNRTLHLCLPPLPCPLSWASASTPATSAMD